MPKSIKEINSFERGIILNTSEKDIPQDTATFSLNVDPNAKNGILSGINSNKLITSVDGNISRVLFPHTWGENSNHINNTTTPGIDNEVVTVSNIHAFKEGNRASFIGTKGYMEQISFLCAIPHMEKLVASISQLGNDPNSTTHAQYQPTGSGSEDITDSATTIDLSDATTTSDLDEIFQTGDFIQFADQSVDSGEFKMSIENGEIMEILDIATDSITVFRGAFNTPKNTYTYTKTYNIWINKISTGGKGSQRNTTIGYLHEVSGYSKIVGNHLKGNGAIFNKNNTSVLKHSVTGSSDKIEFNSTGKYMQITGATLLNRAITSGTYFHYYSSVYNSNHGKSFTVKYYDGNGRFYFKEAPNSMTITDATTHYFEPSLIKNPTFTHQVGTDIGNTEIEVVNDWKHFSYDSPSLNGKNEFIEDEDSNSNVSRGSIGPYSDANVFGSDVDANYYPYSTNSSAVINSEYISLLDAIQAVSDSDDVIKTQNYSSIIPFYLCFGDIIKLDNEYLRVKKVKNGEIHVERGVYNTTPASHSAGTVLFKSKNHSIVQDISKDLIKPDTEYELSFWTKIHTGQAATANITVVDTTIANYDERYFTLISSAGTVKTYWFNHDGSDGATGTVLASNGYVVIQLNTLSGATAIRDEIEAAIDGTTGHNGEITTADSSTDAITLTQAYTGFAGNTTIEKSDNLTSSIITTTDFQYGISPIGEFSIQYNGGYFDNNGDFAPFSFADVDNGLGYISSSTMPSQTKKWIAFDHLETLYGVESEEDNKANGVRWIHLTYKFKTPKESQKTDLKISFANKGPNLAPNGVIGTDATKIYIGKVFLSQDSYLVNTSKASGISVSSGLIDNKGVKDLVMYSHKDSSLKFLLNFDYKNLSGKEALSNVETSHLGATEFNSTEKSATFVNKNKEVHVGFGSQKSDTPPQWIGYLNHKVFGQETTNLYLDQDAIPEYDSIGSNNIEKICLAGEYERMAATWDNSAKTLTVTHTSHGYKNGDNFILRQYMDSDNSWDGQGVWYVQDASNVNQLVFKRNTNLDTNPSVASGSLTFDTNGDGTSDSATGYVSYRPYYYYAISRGDRYVLRITPEDRISGDTTVDSVNYPMGKIERSKDLDFPIESICCSYSKKLDGTDGGYIYALSSYGDKIARLDVSVSYDEWESTEIPAYENIFFNYKSFKWSNSHTNGNIDGTTAVFDSLAEESSPTITPAGMPSDILETKGPVVTFDWDNASIGDTNVDPSEFDTRLWMQHYPRSEDSTFTQGDRFLFCSKSEYNTGEVTYSFADRTPPTNILYGTESRYTGAYEDHAKFKVGPFVRENPYGEDIDANPDIENIGQYALFHTHKQDGSSRDKIRNWSVFKSFDFEQMVPDEKTNALETYAYSKPYVNWGENVGWSGNDNKTTSLKVARYGLFAISDNDCDGVLDGTGVVVPNNDNYNSNEKKYGELHRRMTSHAVGLIGGSDIPWIRRAGRQYGNSAYEYYLGGRNSDTTPDSITYWYRNLMGRNQDAPEFMDASKCVFVCSDIHYGDITSTQNRYDITSVDATGGYAGDLGTASEYTKITTSEPHNLQSGDLVYFKGSGNWGGWDSSFYVIAVKDENEFYVAYDAPSSADTSGELYIGGHSLSSSGNGTKLGAGRIDDIFHYAFNSDEKNNGDIFAKHGAFSRKWYSEQDTFGSFNTGDSDMYEDFYPVIQNNHDRLNFLSGYMIRPFNMDDESFNSLTIAEGISVDMPSFPDTIYHKGSAVKNSSLENQYASKLFISNPGQLDTLGELQPSKIYMCEWNFLYPNLGNSISVESTNSDFNTQSHNLSDVRNVIAYGDVSSYITTAHATDLWGIQKDAVSHPIVQIDTSSGDITSMPRTYKNMYAGLYISIVDEKGFIQTRKIIGSHGKEYFSIHYPFGHAVTSNDKFYIWKHANVATAPIRLFKEETLRHDNSKVYDKDPVLEGPIYKPGDTCTFDGSTAGLVTSNSFHNLTTGDLISIEGTSSFNGTHEVTVKTPKIFQITTSASAAAETGTWKLLDESDSSAANPITTPLNSPTLKMNFGDLDKRKVKTYTVSSSADGTGDEFDINIGSNHVVQEGESLTWEASNADYNGTYIVDDKDTDEISVDNTNGTATPTGTLTTNQWGGIGASAKSSSTIGQIRAGLAQWDKGDKLGNVNRYDVDDNTRFISTVETSVSLLKGASSGSDDYFLKNNNYKYKISLIYDGYQEGPLSSSSWVYNDTTSTNSINVSINVKNYSKRLSHVCVYRKDSEDAFYRLVRQIPTEKNWSYVGNSYNYSFQDRGNLKASYEVRTGVSELNKELSVKYGMSVELSGFLFVGNCSHTEIDNASNQIFRSKPGKFSIFDWSVDFAILKSKPTAMANFIGKLFVFDENNIYRINPFSLQIEDIFEGIGCSHKDSVVVTEYGMYFANRSGAYFHDGTSPIKISSDIQKGGKTNMLTLSNSSSLGTNEIEDLSWDNTAGNFNSKAPYVTFDSFSNTVLFMVDYSYNETVSVVSNGQVVEKNESVSSSNKYIWAYSIEKQRWDLWELANNSDIGKPFTAKDGTVCISIGNMLMALNKGFDKKLYKWMSKKLIMDTSTNKKVFNKIKVVGPKQNLINDGQFNSDTDKLIVATDKGRITSGSNSTTANIAFKSTGNENAEYKLKGSNKTAKWVQFKFEEMEEEVDSIGIIYRLRSIK